MVKMTPLPDRLGYSKVPAIDPDSGRLTEVYISHELMNRIGLRSMGAAKDLAFGVREVLANPTAIFQGVREEGESAWLCYVGIPKHSYAKSGDTRPPRRGEVLLVFVNDDKVAYSHYWGRCDATDHRLPENYSERFRVRRI